MSRKYFAFLFFACCFTVPFLLYWNLFSTDKVFINLDGLEFYAVRIFFAHFLKSGQFTLWNPYLANGVPFAEDLNGVFYPVQIVLSLLPAKLFVYAYYSFHLALGATFMYMYIDEIGCGKVASLCTGAVYLMSIHLAGYRKSHIQIITCAVFLPVILFFIERYIKTKKRSYLLVSALCMSMQFFSGHTQLVLYADMLVFVYLVVMMIKNRFPLRKIIVDGLIWGCGYIGMICVQLLPMANLMKEYTKSGAAETSYDTFCGWSIHPVKLIMMLFPEIFGAGNTKQPFGSAYSSELDIEIFLGVGVFILILFAAILFFRDFRVRLSLAFMIVTFSYCAQAHIPALSRILYKLPIFGGFRGSSRALFIFIFFAYVLFAISLSKLRERETINKLRCFINRFAIFLFTVLGITIFTLFLNAFINNGDLTALSSYLKTAFAKALFVVFILVLLLNIAWAAMGKYQKITHKHVYTVIAALITMITIAETLPYSKESTVIDADSLTTTSSTIQTQLQEDIGESKVLLALNSLDGAYESMLQSNANINAGIPSINVYTTFNNPRLFRLFTDKSIMSPAYNYSGLLTGFLDAKNNIYLQNDLLSMLGVKYILDPNNLVDPEGRTASITGEDKTILEIPAATITGQTGGGTQVWVNQTAAIEDNEFYKITFDIAAKSDAANSLRLDFYGGANYDFIDQDKGFFATEKMQSLSFIMNSGDTSLADKGGIVLRIYGSSEADIQITNLKVIKMKAEYKSGVYKLYAVDGTTNVYENTNVKNILYTPAYLKGIDSTEDIYNNVLEYSLDDTSYIENYKERDISQVNTTIEIMSHTNNGISAKVTADGDTFINFSQNYFPGWKAYVDGKETRIYMVNGLIQGIEVPAGEHTITFRYFPTSLLIGGGITVFTLAAAVILIIIEKRKKRKHG